MTSRRSKANPEDNGTILEHPEVQAEPAGETVPEPVAEAEPPAQEEPTPARAKRKKKVTPSPAELPPVPEEAAEVKEEQDLEAEETTPEPDFGDGPAAEIRRAFWQRSSQFINYLGFSQCDLSENNVHELRVSSRRLTAVLELFSELIGSRPMRKLIRELKQIRRLCGELRELQVHLEMLANDPLLESFYQMESLGLPKLLRRTARKLNEFSAPWLERKLELIDSLVVALIEGADAGSLDHLVMMCQPFIETRAYSEYAIQHMDLDQTSTVHAVRLSLKKFRYQAEFLEEVGVIQGSPEAWEAVRTFHKSAGSLQDLETLTRVIDVHWVNHHPARDVQLKVLGRLWKERQPHLAGLDHTMALDEFEIREDLRIIEEVAFDDLQDALDVDEEATE